MEHLSSLWQAKDYDFELACRMHGRNNAFWVLCYRLHLDGEQLPDEAEARKLIRRANRATGGLDQCGERSRFTLYEAKATIEQVACYRSRGLRSLIERRRAWIKTSRSKKATPYARRLLEAICRVAERAGRSEEFTASHRQLAAMADLHPTQVASLLYSLQDAGQVFRLGFTPARNGQPRGTTRLSLKPPRPIQMLDEAEPPRWDPRKTQWTWSSPLAKGTISNKRWCWLTRRAQRAREAAYVPNVNTTLSNTSRGTSQGLLETMNTSSSGRGSP